jgi:hypothetical protein
MANAKFPLGRLVTTPGVLAQVPADDILFALTRHARGDWGDLDLHDREANDEALRTGERLLSAYVAPNGARFWIITEADRSSTCTLLPEEY